MKTTRLDKRQTYDSRDSSQPRVSKNKIVTRHVAEKQGVPLLGQLPSSQAPNKPPVVKIRKICNRNESNKGATASRNASAQKGRETCTKPLMKKIWSLKLEILKMRLVL